MFKNKLSAFADAGESSVSGLQYRHMGAIATLVLISLLSSLAGTPSYHTISNCWEGLLWGIADPVLGLNRLAGIVAIGLLCAGVVRGSQIAASFVIAALCGTAIYLSPLNLPDAQIAIALSTIALGAVLVLPTQLNWLALAALSIVAGLFQGYANGESTIGLGMVTLVTYVAGITLTQSVIIICAREIGRLLGVGELKQLLPNKIRLTGLAFCAIGIVFLGNSVIF